MFELLKGFQCQIINLPDIIQFEQMEINHETEWLFLIENPKQAYFLQTTIQTNQGSVWTYFSKINLLELNSGWTIYFKRGLKHPQDPLSKCFNNCKK